MTKYNTGDYIQVCLGQFRLVSIVLKSAYFSIVPDFLLSLNQYFISSCIKINLNRWGKTQTMLFLASFTILHFNQMTALDWLT
jgi:hypothetical protein